MREHVGQNVNNKYSSKGYTGVLCTIFIFATLHKFEVISKWNVEKKYVFVSSDHNKQLQSNRKFFLRTSSHLPLLFKELATVVISTSPKVLQTPYMCNQDSEWEKRCVHGKKEVEIITPKMKLSTYDTCRYKALIFSSLSSRGPLLVLPHNSFTIK